MKEAIQSRCHVQLGQGPTADPLPRHYHVLQIKVVETILVGDGHVGPSEDGLPRRIGMSAVVASAGVVIGVVGVLALLSASIQHSLSVGRTGSTLTTGDGAGITISRHEEQWSWFGEVKVE